MTNLLSAIQRSSAGSSDMVLAGLRVTSAIHSGPAGHAALGVAPQRPRCGRHREHNARPRPTALAAKRPLTSIDPQSRTGRQWPSRISLAAPAASTLHPPISTKPPLRRLPLAGQLASEVFLVGLCAVVPARSARSRRVDGGGVPQVAARRWWAHAAGGVGWRVPCCPPRQFQPFFASPSRSIVAFSALNVRSPYAV